MEEDRILGLPEAIISRIFSLLTIKEAARTSILARRWRYIWTVSTRRLDFDMEVLLNKDIPHQSYRVNHRPTSYVEWVDRVLNSIQSPTIDELRICRVYSFLLIDDMHRWVKYAIAKRAKRLEMDFTGTDPYDDLIYPFPVHFFDSSFMSSLKDLSLNNVVIGEGALEYILSKCHVLEKLSITLLLCLAYLEVSSPSLKCLKIIKCEYLRDLQVVDAVNLESFTYEGYNEEISFSMSNVPNLTELSFGHKYYPTSCDIVAKLPLYYPMLKTLKYRTGKDFRKGASKFPDNFPGKFNHLKYLELKIEIKSLSIFHFTSLLKACPSLYRLKVEVVEAMDERDVKEDAKEDPYECLEVVELVGSQVSPDIVEFIFHLVENAENLKKIIIDPRSIPKDYYYYQETDSNAESDEQFARSRVMEQIVPKLPPKIEFVLR